MFVFCFKNNNDTVYYVLSYTGNVKYNSYQHRSLILITPRGGQSKEIKTTFLYFYTVWCITVTWWSTIIINKAEIYPPRGVSMLTVSRMMRPA